MHPTQPRNTTTNNGFDRAKWDRRVESAMAYANGRWDSVIRSLAPQLAPVIDKCHKHTWCPNPSHSKQEHGDAMRTLPDFRETGGMVCNTCGKFSNGIAVLRWWFNWTFGETIKEIESLYQGYPVNAPERAHIPATKEVDPAEQRRKDEKASRNLNEVWRKVIPLDSPDAVVARTYLENRGISPVVLPMGDVGFHPALPYYGDGKVIATFPAIVYVIRTKDGIPGNLQRLYLAPDGSGKAPVDVPKKMMTRRSDRVLTGGACRLDAKVHRILNVSEGFETALSVRLLTGLPTWCCASDSLLASFVPPEGVEFVAVWGDFDPAGIRHGDQLVVRLREGNIRSVAIYPTYPMQGRTKYDWNDALQDIGVEKIRQQSFYKSFFMSLEKRLAERGERLEVTTNVHRLVNG